MCVLLSESEFGMVALQLWLIVCARLKTGSTGGNRMYPRLLPLVEGTYPLLCFLPRLLATGSPSLSLGLRLSVAMEDWDTWSLGHEL